MTGRRLTKKPDEGRRSTEVRQAELTEAALSIIATRGIAALSTRSLAAHVGLSSGAIFRHFATLDALLDAVAARVEAALDSTFPPSDLPPRERLERFIEARSATVGNHVGILRLMLSDQFQLALPEGGSKRLAGCVKKTREFISECVRKGQAEGTIRDDIDAAALVVIVMGTTRMLALSNNLPRGKADEARAVREAIVTLLSPAEKR